MKTYECLLKKAKAESIDYFENKNSIDYFIENKSVDYYLKIIDVLEKINVKKSIEKVVLFDAFQSEVNQLFYEYLDLFEKYLKAYLELFNRELTIVDYNKKRIKFLLNYILSDENLTNELISNDFQLFYFDKLLTLINSHNLVFYENKLNLINNFYSTLPDQLKRSLLVRLNILNEKYPDFKIIINV